MDLLGDMFTGKWHKIMHDLVFHFEFDRSTSQVKFESPQAAQANDRSHSTLRVLHL